MKVQTPAGWARTWRHAVAVIADSPAPMLVEQARMQKAMAERRCPDVERRCVRCGQPHADPVTGLGAVCVGRNTRLSRTA